MDGLIIIGVLALLAGPILAIIALARLRQIEDVSGGASVRALVSRLYSLEQRLAAVEKELATGPRAKAQPRAPEREEQKPPAFPVEPIRIEIPPSASETVTAPPPPIAVPRPVSQAFQTTPMRPLPSWAKPSAPEINLESRIAGNWFNRIGIVLLIFAVSYGLKWAFDNNWIGPSGRVAIGAVLGALMLPWSQWLLGKGYTYFSEGIAALGEATLYLSVWAGCQYYTLYSRDVGFAAMIAITAVMAAVAIGRDSQRIAVLSLLGGLLTPVLVSSGQDQQVVLFTYLLLLGLGGLAIAWKKSWNVLAPVAFVGTQIYFWGWYAEFYHRTSPLERTVAFATLFFLLYSAWPIVKCFRERQLGESGVAMILLNSFAYSGTLFTLLWPDDKWPLTLFFVGLAAAHVAVARIMPEPAADEPAVARLLYSGLALTLLTLAIPIRLDGNWITLSFSVEGAILIWTGFRASSTFLRQAGYLMLAIAALRLMFLPPEGGPFLFNARFGSYLVLIACFGVALWAASTHQEDVAGQERAEIGIFAVIINIFALIALSWEFWDYFGKVGAGVDAALAQHLALTMLWTVYAAILLFFGMQNKSALLRWQSLILFGLVVAKVFLYDLSFLERGYRILSFFVLGAVLLAVSFFYTRRVPRQRENP